MKYFFVHQERLKDVEAMAQILKMFIANERIPMPVIVWLSKEHGDCFIRNEAIVVVSSLALIKYQA